MPQQQTNIQWLGRPNPDKKTINFQCDIGLVERLSEFCDENGVSKSDFMRMAISTTLSRLN